MNGSTTDPTVLIVDDSTSVRCYVAGLLVEAGYLVEEADDGRALLARLAAPHHPEVVLLDVEMPGMSGLDVLRVIGLKPRLFSIILFTTQSSLEQITNGLDLGADDYVAKPFKEADLLARIRAALRNSRHKRALALARQETARALAELQLAQGRLVEQEKVGAVARLAAGAAHHINNPLGFVMSNLSTLERYACGLLRFSDEVVQELRRALPELEPTLLLMERTHRIRQIRNDLPALLQETREGGQRIALIVQQLAQLELGLSNPAMTELDLATLLKPLVAMLADLAPPGSAINWEQPAEPVAVNGSLTMLNSALIALMKNACEALGREPGVIHVALSAQPDVARITITDNGPGVAAKHLQSLFDPFFSTKSPESHVGLGLTIAHRFISGHGGRIFISSTPPGTSVTVEIPRLSP